MKALFDDKGSVEDRLKKLELVATRLGRRAKTTAKALITPYPISSSMTGENVKGSILRYLFPCRGVISKGVVILGEKPKDGAALNITRVGSMDGSSKNYIISNKSLLMEPSMDISSGDRLDISIAPIGETVITEVWISFLWVPHVRDIEAKSYLIEEIENDLLQE